MIRKISILIFILFSAYLLKAQKVDRFELLQQRLDTLSKTVPGLTEKVDFSVVGVSVQEFLRGLAENHNLNISVDPNLKEKVYNNFTNEEVINIIMFLCKEYDLDIHFIGSIMSFVKHEALPIPVVKKAPKPLKVEYDKSKGLLTLDLERDTLSKVIYAITKRANKNVMLAPAVDKNALVSGYVLNMPFENAIDKIAYSNGLQMVKTKDDFYILESLPKEETQQSSGRSNSRNRNTGRRTGNTSSQGSGDFEIAVIDSNNEKYIDFYGTDIPISEIIKEAFNEAGLSYFMFTEPEGNTTSHLKKVKFEDFVRITLQGSDYTYKIRDNVFMIGKRNLEGLREFKIVQLQYRSYEEIMALVPREMKEGVEIFEHLEQNSFVLAGSAPQIAEISDFIHEIDKVVPMIMIEVILVDIQRGHTISTEIQAGLGRDSSSARSILPGIDWVFDSDAINQGIENSGVNIGKVSSDFYLSLRALEENNVANVRSTPKLSTLNGHEATLVIGESRYYLQETQNTQGSLQTNTIVTQQWNEVQANLEITIKPIVSGDDQVTLDIGVVISDFLGQTVLTQPPAQVNRSFNSLVRVRDEEMIVLGGLEKQEKSKSGRGLPFFSRLPVIGWLFGRKQSTKSKQVTLVFIKPHISY